MSDTYYATGRRKSSTARVFLKKGSGEVTVNNRPLDQYFGRQTARMIVRQALEKVNLQDQFDVTCTMPNGLPLQMVTGQRQGILFEGDEGRFFVNRGGIFGKPVEDLADHPLPEDAITKVYKGKKPGSHMGNYFESMESREQPISDVFSHHRAVSVLHLANLCLLLDRKLTWDLASQQIVGDEEATSHQSREQRQGFEITV